MELSNADKEYIANQIQDNPVHRYINNVQPYNYKVGDTLIRYIRDVDSNGNPISPWRLVKVSLKSGAKKKYIVVHVDQFGVPYIKHLRVNGTLGGINCMASIDYRFSKFEPDPEQMEHEMLDQPGDFDPLGVYKENKNETN